MANYPPAHADIKILANKVELVRGLASSLLQTISNKNLGIPKKVLSGVDAIGLHADRFNQLIIASKDLDEIVSQANAVSVYGIDVSNSLVNYREVSESEKELYNEFRTSCEDLSAYCEAHNSAPIYLSETELPLKKSILYYSQKDEQKIARMAAQMEELERALVHMQARLQAMGESADKAVLRVDETTRQQADAMRKALTEEVSVITDGFASIHAELKNRLVEFDGYKALAEEKISHLGLAALVGGHAKSALEEQKAANWYRRISLGLMAAALANVVWLLHDASEQALTLESTIYRAVLSLLLIVPTAYAAKESAKHRGQAIELRRLSLDFAALEPFLKGMQGDEAQKTRAELARRAFFTGASPDVSSSYGLDPQAIIIKGFDTITDVAKKR